MHVRCDENGPFTSDDFIKALGPGDPLSPVPTNFKDYQNALSRRSGSMGSVGRPSLGRGDSALSFGEPVSGSNRPSASPTAAGKRQKTNK